MSPLMLMLQMELPFQDLLYSSGEVALFTLAIPNRLLHEWYRNSTPLFVHRASELKDSRKVV